MDDEANLPDETLPQGEERFRIIYERAGVGIEQVAPDGRLIEVNEALCHLLSSDPSGPSSLMQAHRHFPFLS